MCVFCRSVSRGSQVWAPEGSTAFKCLLSARFCAALLSNISDCDETFNYWEPVSNKLCRRWSSYRDYGGSLPPITMLWWMYWQMHYLLYGTGMQTWEYSPLYAIRSYAYLWLHALPACLHAHVLQTNKVTPRYSILITTEWIAVFAVCPEKYFSVGKKSNVLCDACVVAGTGVLLCAMCPSVRLLCLWTLFLQVSSLSNCFNLCVFSNSIAAQLIIFVTQGGL